MSPLNEDNFEKVFALLGPKSINAVTAVAVEAGWQNPEAYDVTATFPAATAGTVEIQLSADGTTYTTLEAARAIAASGSANVAVSVPAGFFLKLTATTSVLSDGHFY